MIDRKGRCALFVRCWSINVWPLFSCEFPEQVAAILTFISHFEELCLVSRVHDGALVYFVIVAIYGVGRTLRGTISITHQALSLLLIQDIHT